MATNSAPSVLNAASTLTLTATETSAAFIDSVGVNMHSGMSTNVSYAYQNPELVQQALQYLDITHIRDAIGVGFGEPGYDYTTITENYLADRGYKFDFPISSLAPVYMDALHNFVSQHPGALQSLEGPNEANTWTVDQVISLQQSLYNFVHSDASLSNVTVMDFTLAYTQNLHYLAKYGDLSSISDEGNVHIYANAGRSPAAFQYQFDLAQAATPDSKMNVTETGYSTLPSNAQYGVDEATQAKYILDMLMDDAAKHVATTYIYELLDRNGPADATTLQGNFGLFHSDGTPKVAADAIHNLMTILDTGAQTVSQVGQLDVVFNQPLDKSVHETVIQKNANTYDLVLWAEPNVWNSTTQQAIQAPGISVDLSFLGAASATLYDPLVGTAALQVFNNPQASSVIQVTDHPIIVEVTLPNIIVSDTPTYKNGVLVKEVVTYAAAGQEISLTKLFNASGVLTSETHLHADQSKDVYLSAIAGKTYVAEHDVYDATGKLVEVTRTHTNGSLDYQSVLDSNGTKTTDTYDATGTLKSHVEAGTDGYSDTLTYKNGVLASEVVKFATGGAQVSDAKVYANLGGAELSETKVYANVGGQAVLTSDTQVHAGGAKDVYLSAIAGKTYVAEHDVYDAAGRAVEITRTHADGSLDYHYVLDGSDTKTTDTYDTAGKLTNEVVKFAAGGAEVSDTKVYANVAGQAVLTSDAQVHAGGAKDVYLSAVAGKTYVAEHGVYDAAGKAVEITRTHADGSLDYHFVVDSNGTRTDTYDAAGKLASDVVKFAAGGAEVSDTKVYANIGGQVVLTSETLVHTGGARDVYATPASPATSGYQAKHTTYDAGGKFVSTDQTNLDGTHAQSASQVGVTLASTTGVADFFKGVGGDTFTFAEGFGHDVVTGFHAGTGSTHDVLVLDQSEVHDFADLQSHMSASGKDTLINLGGGDTILLTGVAPGAFAVENVHFQDHSHFIA